MWTRADVSQECIAAHPDEARTGVSRSTIKKVCQWRAFSEDEPDSFDSSLKIVMASNPPRRTLHT
ncbi:hypothetical protein BDM02DRAFT_3108308 [Thelephora ganbajun]|uniref:Uncharacterized protein n=1 Tax=Thelephora ganbajun TaxID=370292 RepID=A0ACB6ZU23_THEGA|nr:hypothetical protein BDM02DRAFT_3108308 [Thelephora ganbajun]